MHRQVVVTFSLVLLVVFIATAAPQSATNRQVASTRAEVLVLGVYHMANPGTTSMLMATSSISAWSTT